MSRNTDWILEVHFDKNDNVVHHFFKTRDDAYQFLTTDDKTQAAIGASIWNPAGGGEVFTNNDRNTTQIKTYKMTTKEFNKQLNRLSKLLDKAAYAGDDARYRELDAEIKKLFNTFANSPVVA